MGGFGPEVEWRSIVWSKPHPVRLARQRVWNERAPTLDPVDQEVNPESSVRSAREGDDAGMAHVLPIPPASLRRWV